MAQAVQRLPWLRGKLPVLVVSPAEAFAVRSGVSVSAAIWIGKLPGLVDSHSTWILITVLMLLQPTSGAALLKGVLRGRHPSQRQRRVSRQRKSDSWVT